MKYIKSEETFTHPVNGRTYKIYVSERRAKCIRMKTKQGTIEYVRVSSLQNKKSTTSGRGSNKKQVGGDGDLNCDGATKLKETYKLLRINNSNSGELDHSMSDYFNDRGLPGLYYVSPDKLHTMCFRMKAVIDDRKNMEPKPIKETIPSNITYFKSSWGLGSNDSNEIVKAYFENVLTLNDFSVFHHSVFEKLKQMCKHKVKEMKITGTDETLNNMTFSEYTLYYEIHKKDTFKKKRVISIRPVRI